MDPALSLVMEALARIEQKLDLLLDGTGVSLGSLPQLHFVGQMCPVCKQPVDHQIDILHQVVVRRCGCSTGKVPSTIPLFPTQGTQNGQPDPSPAGGAGGSADEDRPLRPSGPLGARRVR